MARVGRRRGGERGHGEGELGEEGREDMVRGRRGEEGRERTW
jgi:hypothetical protein